MEAQNQVLIKNNAWEHTNNELPANVDLMEPDHEKP